MKSSSYHRNLYGILGTIIVHLVLAILFMLIKLSTERKNYESYLLIDLEPTVEEILEKLSSIDLPQNAKDISVNNYMNIAVNMSDMPEEEFNVDEYIEQLKNEMIEEGDLDENNFIDQWNKADKDATLEYIDNDVLNKDKQERPESQEMAANYRGPTRVYYELKNRFHTKLPLPIYKCEHGGKVVLEIIVGPDGRLTKATVLPEESSSDDNCLHEAALSAALSSRFNPVNDAVLQKGSITYIFATQ